MSSPLLEALKHSSVRTFVLGTFISNIGTWIQRITIGWLVFHQTASAAWVGGVAAAEVALAIVIAPFAGVLVDRSDRMWLLMVGQFCASLQAAALAVLAGLDLVQVPVLGVAAILLGLIDGVNQPARLTLISDVAPRELISSAIGLNSFGFNVARFVGPAIAGLILLNGGPMIAFLLNALSFVPLIGLLHRLRRRRAPMPKPVALTMRAGLRSGIDHVLAHAILRPIFLMLIFYSFLARGFVDLLPAIAGTLFGSSPADLARLTTCLGCGAMAGGIWMMHRRESVAVLSAALAMPIGMISLSALFVCVAGRHWLAYPFLLAAGFFLVACGVGMQSIIHLTVEAGYRGRVLSIYGLIVRALPAAGAVVLGFAADFVGLRIPLLTALALAALVWLIVWRRRAGLVAAITDKSGIF